MYADGGLPGAPADTDHSPDEHADTTRLYFPADQHQFAKCLKAIFPMKGLRFLFSTRSAVPDILTESGDLYYGDGYTFKPDKDDVIREGKDGYIVSFGETLYRAWDAVLTMKNQGKDVGLICKATLNKYDEDVMAKLAKAPAVLVAESVQCQDRPRLTLRHRTPPPRLHRQIRPPRHPPRRLRRPLAPRWASRGSTPRGS